MEETNTLTFEEFKADILEKAKDADACSDGYDPAEEAETKEELLRVIKDNIHWCFKNGVINTESLTAFYSEEELAAESIFIRGYRSVKDVFAVALGNSTVKAWGNSTVEAWGNTTVKAWGNTTVKALGNSTVKAWGNSTVEAWGNSTVEAWDNTTVKALGNSYTLFFNSREKHSLQDKAILKDYYKGKIYIKKSSHEIIEVE